MKDKLKQTNEGELKDTLVKKLREAFPTWVILRHEDRWTAGIPDISITGNGRTTWWEAKYANPTFESKGIQELTMLRLNAEGFAYYVIFAEGDPRKTFLVSPRDLKQWNALLPCFIGFDYRPIITYVREVHHEHGTVR